jgi:hypothetical protein
MPSTTYTDILDRARSTADMRDSDFVTPTDWLRWANLEKYALDVTIARAGIILKEGREDITATGAAQYEINDPIAVLGVYELRDGRYRRLRSSDTMDGAGFHQTNVTGQGQIYRVFQNTLGKISIQFYPIPTDGTYQVFIVPQDAALTTSSSVNYPLGWEERIVLGMAKRALSKEESPTKHVDDLMAQTDRLIEEAAWDRLFAANQRISGLPLSSVV